MLDHALGSVTPQKSCRSSFVLVVLNRNVLSVIQPCTVDSQFKIEALLGIPSTSRTTLLFFLLLSFFFSFFFSFSFLHPGRREGPGRRDDEARDGGALQARRVLRLDALDALRRGKREERCGDGCELGARAAEEWC